MDQLRIHYLQHVPYEGLGCIASWIAQNGYKVSCTKFYEDIHELPDIKAFDWLIVMGGPMGVYDEQEYAWLKKEKTFVRDSIDAGKKVLGICLGAQLAAHCLGAEVKAAPHKEIGWYPILPTDACKRVKWLYDLFVAQPVVFHWHGDQFEIPRGALELATSEANTNQAFLYNDQVLGLQFHLEVTADSLNEMVENGSHELVQGKYIQDRSEILHSKHPVEMNNRLMYDLLDNFAFLEQLFNLPG